MLITSIISITDIPRECIDACSHQGRCDDDVYHWRKKLNFSVDIQAAIKYLKSTGGWEAAELAKMNFLEIAEKILWLACGTFSEYITEAEAEGLDAFDPNLEFESRCGSNIFCMEG